MISTVQLCCCLLPGFYTENIIIICFYLNSKTILEGWPLFTIKLGASLKKILKMTENSKKRKQFEFKISIKYFHLEKMFSILVQSTC